MRRTPSALEQKERIRALLKDISELAQIALEHFDKAPGQVATNCANIELASVEIMNILDTKRGVLSV